MARDRALEHAALLRVEAKIDAREVEALERRERAQLAGWESGQDHVALYLYNCPEYIEGMIGAFKSRTAPFNVNYRYVDEELVYLLRDSKARAIIYHSVFAPTLARIRAQVPGLDVLIQVNDESGNALLDGAIEYEAALASASPVRAPQELSPDDLYILYTGGTTGMPKGVLWRQSDIFIAALGGRGPGGVEPASYAELAERVKAGGAKSLPTPPLMHGAAHWASFNGFHAGNTIVFQGINDRFDPHDALTTIEREKVNVMLIVGDAFARPLLPFPREPLAFQAWIIRRAPADRVDAVLAANLRLWQRVRAKGGTRYAGYGAIPFTPAHWAEHYGAATWKRLTAARRRYDPASVLTPGPGMF